MGQITDACLNIYDEEKVNALYVQLEDIKYNFSYIPSIKNIGSFDHSNLHKFGNVFEGIRSIIYQANKLGNHAEASELNIQLGHMITKWNEAKIK